MVLAVISLLHLLTPQDPAEEFRKLVEEYDRAVEQHREDLEPLDRKTKKAEWEKQFREKHPARTFAPKFSDLSRRARGTRIGVDAGLKVARFGLLVEDDALLRPALEDLRSSYPGSDFLRQVIDYAAAWVRRNRDPGWAEAMLRSISTDETRPLQAAALVALGRALQQRDGAPQERREEGAAILRRVIKDYADLYPAREAEGHFFEKEHLQVGKTPPDFEATDHEGKTFRLSDYRGKVVVLEFWGFW